MYKKTISNFGNFILRLRIFSSYFMNNTYFFALGRGPYMGPKHVGTKSLLILALQSCGLAYCIGLKSIWLH